MIERRMIIILIAAMFLSIPSFPTAIAGEIGEDAPLNVNNLSTDWHFPEWLGTTPHAPVFEVRDTENKYGRYAKQTKTITIKDLIKFHSHFCGGLVESAASLRVAFDILFPDKVVDRTDLRIVSNNSACRGDVAAYLNGTRARFNSHMIDNTLMEGEFYVHQQLTGKTVHVKLNPAVYPKEVKTQMKKIESGDFKPEDIDLFQELQWAYAKRMVNHSENRSSSRK